MQKKGFTFTKLQTNEDFKGQLELMRAVFGQNSGVDVMVRKWIKYYPEMGFKNIFAIKKGSKIIASLCLIPAKWSAGGVLLKVAELGCVATLPVYRNKGLQSWLMKEYHDEISEQAYDLSAIEGIPYYYRQFGYEYALPLQEETEINFEQAPDCSVKHKIRSFKKSDLPRAMNLHENSKNKFYVHTIREKNIWDMQYRTRLIGECKFEAYTVEENNKTIAYFRISQELERNRLVLREITDVNCKVAQSVFAFLRDTGKKRGLRNLAASISYHEPFSEYLMSIGGARRFPYAWQLRIVNMTTIFRKIQPLFDHRLEDSLFCNVTESVRFNFYRNTVQLTLEDGIVKNIENSGICDDRSIRMNPLAFAQLLVGHRSREELEKIYPDFIVKASHKHLVDVLFPKSFSYIHTDI